jgi:hypothetical protein
MKKIPRIVKVAISLAAIGAGTLEVAAPAQADSTYPGGCRVSASNSLEACISETPDAWLFVDGYTFYQPPNCLWRLQLVAKVGSFGQVIEDSGWTACASSNHDVMWASPSLYQNCQPQPPCGPGGFFYTNFTVIGGSSYQDYANSPIIRP